MEMKIAAVRYLVRSERGITDEEDVCLEAAGRKRTRQLIDTRANTAGVRVLVRAFEAQKNETDPGQA
jgi:hypothetical protein